MSLEARDVLDQSIDILLVEDSPGDIRLTREALKEAKVRNQLHVAQDGQSALAFLRSEDQRGGRRLPELILLDLNLPGMDGREVLSAIKSDSDLASIPVVILTNSSAEQDVLRSYKLHANCYITKPINFGRFIEVIQAIEQFWLTVVKLPPKELSNRDHGNAW